MQDISAKELKGHNILAVERFLDGTRHMVEFVVKKDGTPYGLYGEEIRLFLDDAGYQQTLASQEQGEIKIRKDAHVIEGHVLIKKKRRRH